MIHRDSLRLLCQKCFPGDTLAFWRWYFEHVYHENNTLCVYCDGELAASLQMIPCKLRLGDQLFQAHYIYAAATLPKWRNQGIMSWLLKTAEEEGLRRGDDFSVLITQEDSLQEYYARFGYEPRLVLGVGEPYAGKPVKGEICLANERSIPALSRIYNEAVDGMLHLERDESYWKLQLSLFGKGAYVFKRSGKIQAYAFSDERGIIEAAGPMAAVLADQLQAGRPWPTIPGEQSMPIGCIKPLNEKSRMIMEQNRCYLNLMYN